MERAKGRRLIQLVTIVGGVAAFVWALRERWISIEAPREEVPPSFRVSNGAKTLET